MSVNALLEKIKTNPDSIEFSDVINTIESNYQYTPTRFSNGLGNHTTFNEAGTNEGSCKIFAFGQLNNLDQQQTLACFGHYYRQDVLQHPDNNDHANIRHFMKHGWDGIQFEGDALSLIL
ncbi:MAG: HopJ type III effector protein [Gammaproteobacteria bacterium]|nr:HopJ type III effector protein [Gammaproteobacteria bacterium]